MVAAEQPRTPRRWGATIKASPTTVSMARRRVRTVLEEWGLESERAHDLVVICSELVTNAIRHASQEGDEVGLRLQEIDGGCRIEVLDSRPDLSLPKTSSPHGENGRGLILVRELADGMDVVTTCTTKKVQARVLLAAKDTSRSIP
ncbi:ATP-binding protein [Streptomyces sp. CB01881]|uniref:ATP-binding protein n=1 Tax=Streptomyces sp. CB01881 TaxID=2078691 RepID=UPI0019D695C9|nr:ATP-binding protein [Streptomyces sp. CB01881]